MSHLSDEQAMRTWARDDETSSVLLLYHFPNLCPLFSPAFIGFETNNQYEIKNSLGQKIYKAKEKNDCCTRNCCGSLRSFDMKIKDNMDREVIRLIRPFRCVSCWCPCCLQEVGPHLWVWAWVYHCIQGSVGVRISC